LGGDFNHLEVTDCRGIAGEKQMHRRESASWHHMTLRYGLTDAWRLDSFRKLSKKEFTYDNRRAGATSAVSRIDKFMVSQTIEERGGRMEATASVRKLSDHSPLIITIWGQHSAPNNPPRSFDISLLSNERSRQQMLEAWGGNHPPPPTIWTG
jgi:exonuclease III